MTTLQPAGLAKWHKFVSERDTQTLAEVPYAYTVK